MVAAHTGAAGARLRGRRRVRRHPGRHLREHRRPSRRVERFVLGAHPKEVIEMAEHQDTERRPATEPLEETGIVTEVVVPIATGVAANLVTPVVKDGANKLLHKVKQDKK
jgi:hypothetical protein